MNAFIFLPVLAGILVALGQFLLKKNLDGMVVPLGNAREIVFYFIKLSVNPSFVFSLLVMFSGSILYLVSLRFVAFSRAVPLAAGMILACSILLGKLMLHENINIYRMLGVGCILLGTLFISVRS